MIYKAELWLLMSYGRSLDESRFVKTAVFVCYHL